LITSCNDYKDLGKISDQIWKDFPQVYGRRVFIKPNLVVPKTQCEEASCTRIEIVQMVIEKLKDNGCSDITVGDCGFKDQLELTIKSTHYDSLPKIYQEVKFVGLMEGGNFHKFTLRRLDRYMSLFGAKLSDYMLECDLIINISKLKVHKLALVTCAIKNMMGTMIQKGNMHPRGSSEILHKRLCDLYFLTKDMVKWCLIDGIIGSEYSEHYGVPKRANVLISSTDMWEADCLASQVMGVDPESVQYLHYIKERLKISNYPVVPKNFVVPFELPLGYR
jgi:uncharacterized protein (DUF362 family)